jgi:hypothetical protein
VGIIVFSIAAFLSLPKQLVTVYLGVIIRDSNNGQESAKSKIISDLVLVFSFLVTIAAALWIHAQMVKVKPEVLRDKRRARARKEWEMRGGNVYGQSAQHLTSSSRLDVDNESVFNPADSEEDGYRPTGNAPYGAVPHASTHALNPPVSVQPQRWDARGRAIPLSDARRQDSADVVQWDAHGDGGTTLSSPGHPIELSPGARSTPPSQGRSQQAPMSYPPPIGPPPQQSSSLPYHDPYEHPPAPSSAAQNQVPPPTSGGPSTPHYSPRAQSPQPPSQASIPPSMPRYQLHDGPSPSGNLPVGPYPRDPQLETPIPPRIPPPPGPQSLA